MDVFLPVMACEKKSDNITQTNLSSIGLTRL